MDKIVIDLNVILDFLLGRKEAFNAEVVLAAVESSKVDGYICAHELCTLSFFLEKNKERPTKIKRIINDFANLFHVISLTPNIINAACQSVIDDFEDAVISVSAAEKKCKLIVTSNINDFRKSDVPAVTPGTFTRRLK